ncbi:hypothetical protein AZE42_06364 [Rhizopogon vesiculosus]|uniref:Uncharacterized protein n=1 Tax=Rhizopogon vesiculosus TaxID=180088 RepID=A0A1J8QMD6_9AGAM|nr:hypothetical protein AZE42_06364 [Rhizopogon vesiculosus]
MSFPFHAASYNAANPASPHTPDAGEYRTGNRAPPHIRAPLLRAPSSSNDSYSPPQRRRPSFSSINQPVLGSPTYLRSRAVSSTMRMQYPIINATPAPFGMAPSGRSRTMSSGPSMRPLATHVDRDHSSSQYPKATNGIRLVTSQDTRMKSHRSQVHPDQLPVLKRPKKPTVHHQNTHQPPDQQRAHQPPVHQNTHQPPETHHPSVHQAPAAIQQHPMSKDVTLIAAVTAARMDHREFPWYPVWLIATKDWMFPNSSTATVACNVAPQYVLRHTDIDTSLSSPNSGSVVKVTRKSVIPDFALLLQHVRTASNGTPILGSQKVVLIVENKPTQARSRYLRLPCPFLGINGQIGQQALFAFTAHPNLHMIGVIVAFGARWRYVEAIRPGSELLKKWIKYGDPSYKQVRRN